MYMRGSLKFFKIQKLKKKNAKIVNFGKNWRQFLYKKYKKFFLLKSSYLDPKLSFEPMMA